MKRVGNLFDALISYENLFNAIAEVNRTHHWRKGHKPNTCTAWMQETVSERVKGLREIITNGFVPKKPCVSKRYDSSAQKYRVIKEPAQYPDQYVHHALIQILQPIMMKGMDMYCCGSIRGRGTRQVRESIQRWVNKDKKRTKYCLMCDIHHFYDSLRPDVVLDRMKQLIKDRRVLDLIQRITKDGISIGAYTSQWFANTTLQPLDRLIRGSGYCKYYVRYMDNITIFGANKRNLKKLRVLIEEWLNEHGLELKKDWQIFSVDKSKNKDKGRLPLAVGFRYGRGYTLIRKHNLFRIKKALNRYRKRKKQCKPITFEMAAGLISRLGQLKYCKNYNLYKKLFKGERILRDLKNVVRANSYKFWLTWDDYMKQRARM